MNQPAHAANPPPPTLGIGLMIWAGVIAAIVGFIAIGYALQLVPLYAGFTLLWYWANLDKMSFALAPATLVGALGGVANAWALQWAAANGNVPAIVAALVVLALVLLMTILERGRLVCNASYMLFITVCGAPLLQQGEDFAAVVETLLVGALYFGGLVWLAMRIFAGSKVEEAAEERVGIES